MSFTNFEFPNTNFYDGDLRELLAMYKKLVEEYDGIKAEIDEAIKFINEFDERISAEVERITKDELSQINNRVDLLMQAVNNQANELQDGLNEIKKFSRRMDEFENELIKVRREIVVAKSEVLLVIAKLTSEFANFKDSIGELFEGERQRLEQYIIDKVTTIERLEMVSPIDGAVEDVREVVRKIWTYIIDGYGLTAKEYDDLKLTAIEYDRMRITALNYSMKGWFMFFKLTCLNMRNLWTGGVMTVFDAIERLADYHRNSLTAHDYDAIGKTADNYDGLGISAYLYDWEGAVYVF